VKPPKIRKVERLQGAVGNARGYTYGTNLPVFLVEKKLPKSGKSTKNSRFQANIAVFWS
jgi:hypothetical protein